MTTLAILPMKDFDHAKQRLGESLAATPRRALVQAMFADVLIALNRSRQVDTVLVVTDDHGAERIAAGYGALVLQDEEQGHNEAAARGVQRALELGAERALLVPGDCPLLAPAELDGLIERAPAAPSAVIVPDRHGSGTNGLLLTPPDTMAPAFGPGSRLRHEAQAQAAGLRYETVDVPSLGLDIDTPEDLAAAESALDNSHGGAAHTRGMLRQLSRTRISSPVPVTAVALDGVPEVRAGDDLAGLLAAAMPSGTPAAGDVLVLAHKVVSKAEGRTRRLSEVTPTEPAKTLAAELGKDPRHVQVVLDETREVKRAANGVLISVTHHGFVCANAGVDASNSLDDDTLILLPLDPDASARQLRNRLRALLGAAPAVLITDSFGRPWRHGQTDVAIGCAGLAPLEDWRGRTDARGRELKATWIAVADELAAAADLARSKDAMQPAVLISGAERHVTEQDGPGAAALLREASEDLFR